jgi:hypothetical protein
MVEEVGDGMHPVRKYRHEEGQAYVAGKGGAGCATTLDTSSQPAQRAPFSYSYHGFTDEVVALAVRWYVRYAAT